MTKKFSKLKDTAKQLAKAEILTEALPYLRQYAGCTVVIKYGGSAMGDADLARSFAEDVVLLKHVGLHPIVVHGGGPQIGEMLKKLNIETEFIDGLRKTTPEIIDVVEMVLAGRINKGIVASIQEAGGKAVGVSGKDDGMIEAQKLRRTKKDPGSNIERVLDLGFVGEPVNVNPELLYTFVESDIIPVVAPIGMGPNGETFNINADTVAGAIAAAVQATRLFLLTDVPGVLDGDGNVITDLNLKETKQLIKDGTINGGMIPKVETCVNTVKSGVDAAVIIDGRQKKSILIDLFTDKGFGTLFRRSS